MEEIDEYCSTVEKLLEATAAMSLAVENKKTSSQVTHPSASLGKSNHPGRIATKQATFSEGSVEENSIQPQLDRRKSYSQGHNTSSSLDSKTSNHHHNTQQGNSDTNNLTIRPNQDGIKSGSNQMINLSKNSVDRRYSIASTHIAIANHIASNSQGIKQASSSKSVHLFLNDN